MIKKYKIILVVGARPNYMKAFPVLQELKRHKQFQPLLVHTGQHYDKEMSDVFFKDLKMPKPDIYLGVGSGTHSVQTAKIMTEFEKILVNEDPDLVIVVGDVNSTIACSLATAKYRCTRKPERQDRPGKPDKPLIAHVEAGLRSFDRTMPEEINRLLTDQISDYLFTTCKDADRNLIREGIPKEKIFFVGNTMIDSLRSSMTVIKKQKIHPHLYPPPSRGRGRVGGYVLVTLHRPSNVDDETTLRKIMQALTTISKNIPILFPAHPRTLSRIQKFRIGGFVDSGDEKIDYNDLRHHIILTPPMGYLDFMSLMANAALVLTDSGGIQEETTILGIPCLTLRNNTERPITITQGTNKLVGTDPRRIIKEAMKIVKAYQDICGTEGSVSGDQGVRDSKYRRNRSVYHRNRWGGMKCSPKYWDGRAAKRIVKILIHDAKRLER